MAGRLQQFVKKSKSKKEEEAKRQKEVHEKAFAMVPRCELNADLPEDASPADCWKAIQKNFEWSFGPSKGKSLRDTKNQFLKWAMRKLKDPVRTICHIELMIREKQFIEIQVQPAPSESDSSEPDENSPSIPKTVEKTAEDKSAS